MSDVIFLFFNEEKKYNEVFLEGGDGINDFPWAIQMVMIQLPVSGWEHELEMIGRADIILIEGVNKEENWSFIAKAQKIYPGIPIFEEKLQNGLSQNLKDCLKSLFAAYVEKREKIKDKLELQHPDARLSCAQARRLAQELEVNSFLVGSVCDELGYRITNCGLGCF